MTEGGNSGAGRRAVARKRRTEVVFRIRSGVRQRYEDSPLEGPERMNFNLLLKDVTNLLVHYEGIPPGAEEDERDPGLYSLSYSALQMRYRRHVDSPPGAKTTRIIITVVSLTCARPGRPEIQM